MQHICQHWQLLGNSIPRHIVQLQVEYQTQMYTEERLDSINNNSDDLTGFVNLQQGIIFIFLNFVQFVMFLANDF